MKKLLLIPILLASCIVLTGPQRPHEAISERGVYCEYTSQDTAYCYGDYGAMYSCVYDKMQWECVKL